MAPQKFKLPAFPPTVIPNFKRLCRVLNSTEMAELRAALATRMEQLKEAGERNPRVDIALANEINDRCTMLFERYDKANSNQKAMIVAAIAYFAIEEDALNDEAFATGLHDDAQVMNYVLQELGFEEGFVEIV